VRLTRENTAIVLDSTSDFVDARDRHANMRLVPLYVLFDGESLRDHVDIARAVSTSGSRPRGRFHDVAAHAGRLPRLLRGAGRRRLRADLVAPPHVEALGTFESAVRAAEQLGGDRVRLVDTETASLAVALLAEAVDRRLDAGTSDEEIERLVERFKETNGVVFTVATLEYLQKGGRIGKAQALAGSLLNVKPILTVEDGVIVPLGRVRGRQKALEEFAKLFAEKTEDRDGAAHRDRARGRAGVGGGAHGHAAK
jgi:fatty acid-binding protein DegV